MKWTFGDVEQTSAAVIDNAGNIYIISGHTTSKTKRKLYSLNPGGEINWEFELGNNGIWDNTEPTIDYYGNIYCGFDTLYSVTNGGKLRWKKYLNGRQIISSILCDIDNVIYVGTRFSNEQIIAFESTGELKWIISDLPYRTIGAGASISENGTLFWPSWRNYNVSVSIIN